MQRFFTVPPFSCWGGIGTHHPRLVFKITPLLYNNLCGTAQEMGREQGEPQTIAALRVGTMLEYGLVPYLGANVTKALEYYQEVCVQNTFLKRGVSSRRKRGPM